VVSNTSDPNSEHKHPATKILVIHSFAIHGTASMKVMLSVLGSRILPVPSLLLTGLTNIPGIVKTNVAFQELLEGSLAIARQQQNRLIFYVGYLGSVEQAEIILNMIDTHRDIIDWVVVDPVSGDHGRTYVPQSIIEVWPRLLAQADWALPNYTEVQLLSKIAIQEHVSPKIYLEAFQKQFPNLSFLTTSFPDPSQIGIYIHHEDNDSTYFHERLPQFFGGTGDVFASLFIQTYFLESLSLAESVEEAANGTLKVLKKAIAANSHELLIYPHSVWLAT